MTTPAAGAEAQETGAEQAQTESTGPDFSPVMERVEQLGNEFAPVIDWVRAQQEQAAEANDPDAEYQNFINSLFGGEEQPAGAEQLQQVPQIPEFLQDPQMFQSLIDRAVERGVEQRVGPRLEAFENERVQRQVNEMLDELPGLNDPQAQHDTMLAAQQIAHEMGQPEAWRHPAFFKMAYLARLAEQRSDAEVPADASGGGAQLESGGGGNPGGDEPSLAQQIIGAHRGQAPGDYNWF